MNETRITRTKATLDDLFEIISDVNSLKDIKKSIVENNVPISLEVSRIIINYDAELETIEAIVKYEVNEQ